MCSPAPAVPPAPESEPPFPAPTMPPIDQPIKRAGAFASFSREARQCNKRKERSEPSDSRRTGTRKGALPPMLL